MSERKTVHKPTLLLILVILLIGGTGYTQEDAQDPLLAAFTDNFRRATEETKLEILRDSVNYSPELMGPLYLEAIEYSINNSDQVAINTELQEIALLSAQLAGLSAYAPAARPLWDLFGLFNATDIRIAILDALKAGSLGTEAVFQLVNRWFAQQVSVFRAGGGINTQVLTEAVLTLGSFRDPRAFPQLLSVSVLNLSQEITARAQESLRSIEGDYASMVTEVIADYPVDEKLVALRTAIEREGMSNEEKAGVCIRAIEVGISLALSNPASAAKVREMRTLAAGTLRELRWAEATPQLINHFDRCVLEYDRGIGSKSALLQAIAALGAMGTREAAVRLALYLEVINSFVENNQGYDEQIALAVVRNLEQLKSKAGLNALLYLGYLDYSKSIRDAAEKARRTILGQ